MLIVIILCLIPITVFFIGGLGTKNKTLSSDNNAASEVTDNDKDNEESKPIEVKDNNTSENYKSKSNYKENTENKNNSSTVKSKDNYKDNKAKPNKPTQKPKPNPSNKSEQYASKNLGFTIDFPESWKGHYNVVEGKDYLRVSFKPSKEPLTYEGEGVLFMILKKTPDLKEDGYDTIGSSKYFEAKGATYLIGGPLDFPMKENHPEVKEYKEMMKERPNVLKTIKAIK